MNNHYDELADPRRQNENLRHNFIDLMTMAVSAMICGADNWVAMETFARSKEPWLRSFLALPGKRAHGRQETRRCWVCSNLNSIDADLSAWQGLAAIVVVASERTVKGKTTEEHRFYITSKKASADYYLAASRRHWLVQNQLHWVLDVAFDEDRSRTRKDYGTENLSVLRRIALNLLK